MCIVSAAPECHRSDDAHMWTLEQGDTGVHWTLVYGGHWTLDAVTTRSRLATPLQW